MSTNQEKLNEQLFNVVADEKVSDEARLKRLKYLVRLGADVNAKLYGKSVLSKAIEQNAGAQVQNFLREKGANEWVISKEEALELSRGFRNDKGDLKSLEEIKQLLKKGADLEAKDDEYGRTALMKAARSGQLDVVEYLVQSGADVNVKDGWHGRTALMKAAHSGQLDVVEYLVQSGADVNVKDGWHGRTALMWAVNWGKLDVVKCLVECGADVEAKDEDSWTALDIAKDRKRDDCVKFLEEAQKKVSAQKTKGDKTGVSPIVKKNEGR